MITRSQALFIAFAFLSGLTLGQGHYFFFVLLLFASGALFWLLRDRRRQAEAAARPEEKPDDPPDFVREEVLEGETDTSARALTPEYKKKIRGEIEVTLLDSLGLLLELLKNTVPYHTAALFRRGKNDVLYLFLYNSASDHILLGEAVTFGSGLVGQIMKDKEGRVVSEGDIRATSTTLLYYRENENIRSFLGVPVSIDGVCRGALIVDSKESHAFDEQARRTLEIFAHTAGMLQYFGYLQLENRIDRNKVTALSSLQRNFFRCADEREVIASLGAILNTLVRSERAAVALEAAKKGYGRIAFVQGAEAEFFTNYEFPFSEKGLVSLVFERNALVKRRFDPGRYIPRFSVREKVNHELKSILAVPIPSGSGESAIGVIVLESATANHYSQIDAENVQNLANAFGIALEKIKMLSVQTHLATIDGPTALPNHREFQNTLERGFKRAQRMTSELALILSDIDHFKKVNDTYGHPSGDAILKGVADLLRGSIRKDVDFVARYGGEEFACIVESGADMAIETAERMRLAVEKAVFDVGAGKRISVTMSFGVAVFPADAGTRQQLIERADKALYSAKKAGRNQVKKF